MRFFVDKTWDVLPQSWLPHLDVLSLQDLASMLESPVPPQSSRSGVWPLSLMAFLAAVHALRLPGQLDERGETDEGGQVTISSKGRCREVR